MLKKLVLYFLLLNLFNTVFFVGAEQVGKHWQGEEIIEEEEYNSVVEFVVEGCMDVPDETPEDEDDDVPDSFEVQKKIDHCFLSDFEFITFSVKRVQDKVFFNVSDFNSCDLEMNLPPPERA